MSRTSIDWLGVSFKDERWSAYRFLDKIFEDVGPVQREQRGGVHGFQHSEKVTIDGAHVGLLAYGGQSQNGRSYVELSGVGCQLVRDWEKGLERVLALPDPKIKRVDIAADFLEGEVSYEDTLAAYDAGKFRRGIRSPKMHQILPGDPVDGRTLYVGRGGNDVLFRSYEKGRKEHHPEFPRWLRLELELRSAKRALPFEIIPQRDQFFAGCYAYLGEVLPEVTPEILIHPQRIANSNLAHLLSCVRAQYGPTLYTAVIAHGGSITDVWQKIVGQVHNERLVDAGVLLHDRAA